MTLDRRNVLKIAGAVLSCDRSALAASDFWNKKQPSDWSAQEVAQLLTRSPWSKEVNADFTTDTAVAEPKTGRGGAIVPPSQIELGRDSRDTPTGARRRQPVTVRWESAQPIRDAAAIPLSADFKERYVLSVSGLPMGVMDKRGSSVGDQPRMIEQLKASATLEAKGQEPEQPGVVHPAPRAPGTYLFGFSKELLPLDSASREILFTLRTGLMAVKAKFDAKTMVYRGNLAF